MARKAQRKEAFARMKHALWAGFFTCVLSLLLIPAMLDEWIWVFQTKMASTEASGEIAYVGSREDLADPDFPHRRRQLAQVIENIDRAGAEQVYVDIVFDQPSTREADALLNEALKSLGPRGFLVRNYTTGLNGVDGFRRSNPIVRNAIPEVGTDLFQNVFGFVWEVPFVVTDGDASLPSLSAMLADTVDYTYDSFAVSYYIDTSSIPTYELSDLSTDPELVRSLAGKKVVIGVTNRNDALTPNVPGQIEVPPSIIHIVAAETLLADQTGAVGSIICLIVGLIMLSVILMIRPTGVRRFGYLAIVLAVPVSMAIFAHMGMKLSAGSAIFTFAIYGGFRLRQEWKSSFRLVDEATNLPTFLALEKDGEAAATVPAIIVAKIHRFEEVRKTLPQALHGEYHLRIVDRLRAAKHDAKIYIGPGHLIAWTFPEKEPALIREHLEGLRALFSSPLQVGNTQVDISVTFGVDITPSPIVARRLAAAVSAAERTTETYDPIEIAELASDEDLIWNISLQARIDAALANGEIYLIYQPKVLVTSGELVGVEALVRWRDPSKGLIPPDHFIRQCENAGRMNHLTRHVLTEACIAGNEFEQRGIALHMSVNISATLVHESAIVTMVRDVLAETGFDPRRLTLEITETYRISNFERARAILEDLAALGPKISMDDFGVGAASLEALQNLPFDELKIDRMFTMHMKQDAKAATIVRNVLALGKDLRIIVVAEGVEDAATLTLLRESGCQIAQGFGISRPISFQEILKFQSVDPQTRLKSMV